MEPFPASAPSDDVAHKMIRACYEAATKTGAPIVPDRMRWPERVAWTYPRSDTIRVTWEAWDAMRENG